MHENKWCYCWPALALCLLSVKAIRVCRGPLAMLHSLFVRRLSGSVVAAAAASATVAARLNQSCRVYMGDVDIQRQAINVFRMRLLGAEVCGVSSGSATLKDALNEAMRDWGTNVDDTGYVIGTVAGPHPYPMLVRDFQCVIGREARAQALAQTGKLPDALVACVGGGSNAMGLFYPFVPDEGVKMYGVEAAGRGLPARVRARTGRETR